MAGSIYNVPKLVQELMELKSVAELHTFEVSMYNKKQFCQPDES